MVKREYALWCDTKTFELKHTLGGLTSFTVFLSKSDSSSLNGKS